MEKPATFERYLENWSGEDDLRRNVSRVLISLSNVSWGIAELIAQVPFVGTLGTVCGDNADGDAQKELDVIANRMLVNGLRDAPLSHIISEELETPVVNQINAPLTIAIDPLDGSSNIDTNISMGTIFSIFETANRGETFSQHQVLQPGTKQLAAGYVIYGPQTALVMTVGEGTHIFSLDRSDQVFRLTTPNAVIPPRTREFAINASNFRHWDTSVRAYVDDCLDGGDGPREASFNMRWIASLVAECHRILSRGGIFLYPSDGRKGYGNGRLRLVYEANSIAWLIEQAGGAATTGLQRILEIQPRRIHQRVPLIFGSRNEVERVGRYYSNSHGLSDRAPLFAQRGLFLN